MFNGPLIYPLIYVSLYLVYVHWLSCVVITAKDEQDKNQLLISI